jgi:hypothetical protein
LTAYSPELSRGFYSALEDVKPKKSFVVYGGDDRFKLNQGIEAISLRQLQQELGELGSTRST